MSSDALRARVSPSGPFETPATPSGGTTGYGLYAARPAPGNRGNRYISSDGRIEFVDDGTVWRPLIAGVPGTQPPLVATFTPIGAGYTFADATGTLVAVQDVGATQLAALVVPKGAANMTIAHIRWAADGVNALTDPPATGFCIRDSATDQLTACQFFVETVGGPATPFVELDHWTNPTTVAAVVASQASVCDYTSGGIWMRFQDDGVDHIFEYSSNGVDWVQFFSEPRTTFLPNGGDQVGWVLQTGNPVVPASANLVSFSSVVPP